MYHALLIGLFLAAAANISIAAGPTPTPTAGTPTVTPRPPVFISAPTDGEAVQGSITIQGGNAVPNFNHAEVAFAYADSPTRDWFLIAENTEPIQDGTLAQWDTTTITDGTYDLRLAVWLGDGSQATAEVLKLRVRNYSPVETDTPAPTLTPVPGATLTPTLTPTLTATPIPPTATLVPANEAQITSGDIRDSLQSGVLIAIALFAVFGLFWGGRSIIRNRKRR